jgi:hypothetical protein
MNLNYAHLPRWLENNWLFRTLFLLRKLYLTKRKFFHYAQFAEDITIKRAFPKGYKGTFVDVGCFHPIKYNNTYMLYKKGWRGINIDIDSIKIDGFNIVRPNDINVTCAISSTEGDEIEYYSSGFYSLTNTLDPEFASEAGGYVKKTCKAYKLTTIIDNSVYKDQHIDLLSIDTEAHDLEVLKSLNFQRYAPTVIAIELHLRTFNDISKSAVYTYLVDKGYELIGWCGPTLILKYYLNR